ncbi:MAG: hypothetical protein ACREJX_12380, partial [Polyangiaceae bacterium]
MRWMTAMFFGALAMLPQAARADDAHVVSTPTVDDGAQLDTTPLYMHRHRLSIAPETFFFASNAPHEDFAGLGLAASFFLSDRWGVKLSGDWLA